MITVRSKVAAVATFAAILSGCSSPDWLISNLSPDGKANAVLFRVDSGAWASFSYDLQLLTEATPRYAKKDTILSTTGLRCIYIKWKDSKTIEITYWATHTNFVKTEIPDERFKVLLSQKLNCGESGDLHAVIYAPRGN